MERRPSWRAFQSLTLAPLEAAMRLALICVGRMKAGPERELFERYFKRLADASRAVGISSVDLREIPESRARRPEDRRVEESAAIRAAAPAGSALVALDERGQSPTQRAMGRRPRRDPGRIPARIRCRNRRTRRARPGAPGRRPPDDRLRRDDLGRTSSCGSWRPSSFTGQSQFFPAIPTIAHDRRNSGQI